MVVIVVVVRVVVILVVGHVEVAIPSLHARCHGGQSRHHHHRMHSQSICKESLVEKKVLKKIYL